MARELASRTGRFLMFLGILIDAKRLQLLFQGFRTTHSVRTPRDKD